VGDPGAGLVSLEHVEAGIVLIRWYLAEALRLYGGVRGWEKARDYGAVACAGFRHHGIGSGGTPSFGKPEARRDLTWSM